MGIMKVKIKKLHPDAVIPQYAHETDACFDLTAISTMINKYGKLECGTGLAFDIPEGYVGLIFPRSSVYKTCHHLSNSVGIIDSGFHGEIKFMFDFNGDDNKPYDVGDRVGQMMIVPIPKIELETVEELGESERGTGGFGSTGK